VRQSARLIFNSGAMFTWMVLTVGVGLYATRILLNILGHSDFGLLTTPGANGTLITFFGYSPNQSAERLERTGPGGDGSRGARGCERELGDCRAPRRPCETRSMCNYPLKALDSRTDLRSGSGPTRARKPHGRRESRSCVISCA